MAKAVKIFELSFKKWLEGYSLQADAPIGGRFQQALGFNPFDKLGFCRPALSPVAIDATTITTQIKQMAAMVSGGVPYAFCLGDRSGTAAKCFYRVNLNSNAVTDYSDKIFQDNGTGAVTAGGITTYKSRIVYANAISDTIRANLLTPTAIADVTLLSSAGITGGTIPARFHVGADKVLYYTAPATFSVGRIDTISGTGGANLAAVFLLESGFIPRDITGDGYYEVIISDKNDGQIAGVSSACSVYFWDRSKGQADRIWPIEDDYLVSCEYINGAVKIIGKSGIWLCTISEPPKLVFPFPAATFLPSSAYQVDSKGNTLHWAPTNTSLVSLFLNTFAYGATIGKPIVYSPFITTQVVSNNQHSAFCSVGDKFLAATTEPALYLHNSGSTRGNAVIENAAELLDQPFQYSHTKVTLRDKMTSGQSVSLSLINGTGDTITGTVTKSFGVDGAKKDMVFLPAPAAGTVNNFEEVVALIQPAAGATIKRVAVYGIPQDDATQVLD